MNQSPLITGHFHDRQLAGATYSHFAGGHGVWLCEHGVVIRQCRCWAYNKPTIGIVLCDHLPITSLPIGPRVDEFPPPPFRCHAGLDGDCTWTDCPQLRDNEPHTSHRHCPLDTWVDPEQ